MTSDWPGAILFCLVAGQVWGFYKEFSDTRKLIREEDKRPFNPGRAALFGLAGGGACLVGLIILTYLGLTELRRF